MEEQAKIALREGGRGSCRVINDACQLSDVVHLYYMTVLWIMSQTRLGSFEWQTRSNRTDDSASIGSTNVSSNAFPVFAASALETFANFWESLCAKLPQSCYRKERGKWEDFAIDNLRQPNKILFSQAYKTANFSASLIRPWFISAPRRTPHGWQHKDAHKFPTEQITGQIRLDGAVCICEMSSCHWMPFLLL